MNGNTGRIGVVAASFLGRLALSFVVIGASAVAQARAVPPPHDVVTIAPATFTVGSGAHPGEARLLRAVHELSAKPTVFEASFGQEPLGDRIDEIALLSAVALQTTPFSESRLAVPPTPFETRPAKPQASYGLPLPEPDGWTAVAATIALALFFFLRRLT